jgi:uncharacterized peroxidase-related enzyme
LDRSGRDGEASRRLVEALGQDWTQAELSAAEHAMLRFATRLTQHPADTGEDDIAALRAAGFDDGAIHDLCAVVAYFNFVNRIASGLGVELEERFR